MWYCKTEYALRDASQAVRRLLAEAFLREYGEPVPAIAKTPEGKPYFPSRPDIYFSLSHSGEHLLCALGEAPVGCDVQLRRALSPGTEEKLMDERERRDFGFFELWCLRESFLKMNGSGSLRSARFRREGERIIAPSENVVCRLYDGIEGCSCAVCTLGDEATAAPVKVELSAADA